MLISLAATKKLLKGSSMLCSILPVFGTRDTDKSTNGSVPLPLPLPLSLPESVGQPA